MHFFSRRAFFFLFLFSGIGWGFSYQVRGAELNLHSSVDRIRVGQIFDLTIEVNTQKESANAFQGSLRFPPELLQVESIQDGQSVVNFWVESPKRASAGEISFSGMTPGGVDEEHGYVFMLRLKAIHEGMVNLFWREAKVLKNDGLGTELPLAAPSVSFEIVSADALAPSAPEEIHDQIPPEPFALEISRDPHLFSGRWFIAFATQDKDSGIDHYEVQEQGSKGGEWIRATSPFELVDQELQYPIRVRAIDRRGNIREAILPAAHPRSSSLFLPWQIFGILCLGLMGFWFFLSRRRRAS